MKIVGLTGGISTGKSTVSHFISSMRIPVIDADVISRNIVKPGTPSYHLILDHFGYQVLTAESHINRAALGSIIFNDAEERIALNSITHPRIRIEMLKQVLKQFLLLRRIIVLDTPLLFEAGFYRWVHTTIVVYCPQSMQLERLMARDGINTVQARAKMDSQMSIEQKKTLAHHIIDNSGSIAATKNQAEDLLNELTPSFLGNLMLWGMLFWPAWMMLCALIIYTKLDEFRHVGFFSRRPIPVSLKTSNPLDLPHASPAAGPSE